MSTDEKECCKGCGCTDISKETPQPHRRRGLTSVTLQWLAEKFRRAQNIKNQLSNGTYTVDSDKIAKAILNSEAER